MRAVWILVAIVGAVAFALGAASADAPRAWSIYLVNLVFWSGLAVTGPAIAGMMQLTEARWSPTVRRLALTTAGVPPGALVLLLGPVVRPVGGYPPGLAPVSLKGAGAQPPIFLYPPPGPG